MKEKNMLYQITCGNNFAYVINENKAFLSTEYKVLQSQENGLFIRCMKMSYNGKIQLYYMPSGHKSLMNMIPSIDAENFMTIVVNLFAAIIEVENNGFLSCQNIDISLEHIFVDPFTYKVSLVYLPVGKRLFFDISSFENELRASLVKLVQSSPSILSPRTKQFSSDLSNGMLSVENIYSKYKGLIGIERKLSTGYICKETTNKGIMKFVAMNAPVSFEMEISKNEFVIGKKREVVDGVISFNRMISRSHCKVTRRNDDFAITDLGSANGTYINNVRLEAEQPCPIKNGDMVRLANSEFMVRIE